MEKQDQPITLLFDFSGESLLFTEPLKIYQTERIDEVLPKLAEIQKELDQGYYAAGYVSYEAAPAFDQAFVVKSEEKTPLLWFGIFRKPENGTTMKTNHQEAKYELSKWETDTTLHDYESCIQEIKNQIEYGHTYQVNYTMRLRSLFNGDAFSFYQDLAKAQSSEYSAYLNTGSSKILSASPELFFHWKDDRITTRPMKGTVKRGHSIEQDSALKQWLSESEKNKAENLMIVDLLRNDLGSLAEKGTVNVESLFSIEQYPTVWQMTSTITAKTKPKTTFIDIFKALFPCGSITGAPKISTMKIISNLEQSPREVYCGAIGYLTPDKEAIFNVPIRTAVIDTLSNTVEYGVGGGITWDSTLTEEYEEAFLKAELLTTKTLDFALLESLKLENGNYYLFEKHIERITQSARFFGFHLSIEGILESMNQFALKHPTGIKKVRLLVEKDGNHRIEGIDIVPFEGKKIVTLADYPIMKDNAFLYHKTTNRTIYQSYQNRFSEFFDVLLWNDEKELTEFTNGNVVLKIKGDYVTPSIQSGLLQGTFRKEMLEKNRIKEKTLTIDDLSSASEIWFINSVRGWVQVELRV